MAERRKLSEKEITSLIADTISHVSPSVRNVLLEIDWLRQGAESKVRVLEAELREQAKKGEHP